MASFKKVYKWLAPDAAKEDDGRDKWPSRASFILAAMVSLFTWSLDDPPAISFFPSRTLLLRILAYGHAY